MSAKTNTAPKTAPATKAAEKKAVETKAPATKAAEKKAAVETKPETKAESKQKRVTLKSQAQVIWDEAMKRRIAGEFDKNPRPNRDFRKIIIDSIMADLDVSLASSATMFNTLKKEAEVAAGLKGDDLGLGRDPKVEKPKKEKAEKKETVTEKTPKEKPEEELTEPASDVPADDAATEEEEAVA